MHYSGRPSCSQDSSILRVQREAYSDGRKDTSEMPEKIISEIPGSCLNQMLKTWPVNRISPAPPTHPPFLLSIITSSEITGGWPVYYRHSISIMGWPGMFKCQSESNRTFYLKLNSIKEEVGKSSWFRPKRCSWKNSCEESERCLCRSYRIHIRSRKKKNDFSTC